MRSASSFPGFASVLLLCSCQTGPVGSSQLSSVGLDNNLRSQLLAAATPIPVSIAYVPGLQCNYIQSKSQKGNPDTRTSGTIITRKVGLNIQIVSNESNGDKYSMLITTNGHIIDFNNGSESFYGERSNPQNFDNLASNKRSELLQKGTYTSAQRLHIVNDWSVKIPDYSSPNLRVGQAVSGVNVEGGEPWALFFYRGVTSFEGKRGALLDLMLLPASAGGTMRLVGFNVVDITTGLPIVSVLDAGTVDIIKQVSCQ